MAFVLGPLRSGRGTGSFGRSGSGGVRSECGNPLATSSFHMSLVTPGPVKPDAYPRHKTRENPPPNFREKFLDGGLRNSFPGGAGKKGPVDDVLGGQRCMRNVVFAFEVMPCGCDWRGAVHYLEQRSPNQTDDRVDEWPVRGLALVYKHDFPDGLGAPPVRPHHRLIRSRTSPHGRGSLSCGPSLFAEATIVHVAEIARVPTWSLSGSLATSVRDNCSVWSARSRAAF